MTDNRVTMTALDTLHVSNVQSEALRADDVFIVNENDAKILERAGLAERGGTASKAVNADATTTDRPDTREDLDADRGFVEGKAISGAPANKMADAPDNKTTSAASAPTRATRTSARKR